MEYIKIGDGCYVSNNFYTNKKDVPIVVVCGWLNGTTRPLQKYSDMYLTFVSYRVITFESKSTHFIRATGILFGKHPYKDEFEKVKHFFSQQQVIVHVMCNGGCATWGLLHNYIKASHIDLNISSIVFDSCPSVYNPDRPIDLSILYAHLPFGFKKLFWICLLVPLAWLMTFYFRKHPEKHFFSHIRRILIEQTSTIPKLFIYSQSDILVRYTDIQSIIAFARQISIESNNSNQSSITAKSGTRAVIQEVDFVDSKHVAHLMAYPEKYKNIIKSFIESHVVK